MKRSKLNKVSKQSSSLIQRKLWEECRRIAREQFSNSDGTIDCYTCRAKNLQGSNCQLGHVPYPKSVLGAYLKYDVFRVLKWQCARCNIFGGGMGAEAYKRMLKEEGQDYMDRLEQDRQITIKAIDHYTALLEEYKTIRI
jgi:hypothetical protein